MACICRFKAFYSLLDTNHYGTCLKAVRQAYSYTYNDYASPGNVSFLPYPGDFGSRPGASVGWPVLSSHLKLSWSSTVHLIYYISCHLFLFSLIYFTVIYCLYIIYLLLYFCLYAILFLLFLVLFIYVFIFCIIVLCFLFILSSLKRLFACLFIS